MKPIIFDNFHEGQQQSKWFEKTWASIKNVHGWRELGVTTCANKMTELTDVSDNLSKANLMCNWADKYLFIFNDSNYGVYRYTIDGGQVEYLFDAPDNVLSASTYQATLVPEAYSRVYFATRDKLYKIDDPQDAPTVFEEVGTFTGVVDEDRPRPMLVHGLDFYIGTDEHIASVDASGVFTSQALDIEATSVITDMVSYGDDILISGISLEKNIHSGFVMRYDTFSESFYARDEVDEDVNCLMNSNNSNIIFASIGQDGDIYYYNGNILDFYKTTNTRWEGTYKDAIPSHNTRAIVKGQTYFCTLNAVWTLHRRQRDVTFGLIEKYQTVKDIDCMIDVNRRIYVLKGGQLYWDGQDLNQATAELTTSVIQGKADSIRVAFNDLPTNTSITIETLSDSSTTWVEQPIVVDEVDEYVVRTTEALNNARTLQVRIKMIPYSDNSPKIEYVEVK